MTKSSEEIKKEFWDFSEKIKEEFWDYSGESEAKRRKLNPEAKWFQELIKSTK